MHFPRLLSSFTTTVPASKITHAVSHADFCFLDTSLFHFIVPCVSTLAHCHLLFNTSFFFHISNSLCFCSVKLFQVTISYEKILTFGNLLQHYFSHFCLLNVYGLNMSSFFKSERTLNFLKIIN